MSLFDSLLTTANGVLKGVFGDTATWAPAAGGATQTGTVLFCPPTDPASLDFADYLAASPAFEYHAGTFDDLRASVIAGNSEQVTIGGASYDVLSVSVIEDGQTYRAVLGESTVRQAREVPGSDKAVKLVKDTIASYNPATESRPSPVRTTIVDFKRACTVRNLSIGKDAEPTGTVVAGDLELLIPAALVTEAQLRTTGALLTYGTSEMEIMRVDPASTRIDGTVIQWRVIAKQRAANSG